MMDESFELTDQQAAEAFARAWNRRDIEPLELSLNEHTVYESQWVFSAMEGKETILNYLQGKFEMLRAAPDMRPYFELGTLGMYGACVLMAQGSKENVKAVAIFQVFGMYIKRIDICFVPSPYEAERTGNYPG